MNLTPFSLSSGTRQLGLTPGSRAQATLSGACGKTRPDPLLSERIRAHALICFLALLLHRLLRLRLKATGSAYSPQRALATLRQIQRHRIHIGETAHSGISRPTEEKLRLFEELKLPPPR